MHLLIEYLLVPQNCACPAVVLPVNNKRSMIFFLSSSEYKDCSLKGPLVQGYGFHEEMEGR